jgi:hypothetical protein
MDFYRFESRSNTCSASKLYPSYNPMIRISEAHNALPMFRMASARN